MRVHVTIAVVADAPVKVQCLSCKKPHIFRAAPPGTKSASSTTGARRSKTAKPSGPVTSSSASGVPGDFAVRVAEGHATARAYAPVHSFALGEVLRHPTLGLGLVVSLPAPQKMEVAFEGGVKLLMHGRGGANVNEMPAPQRPRFDEDAPRLAGTSDAPLRRV
jgi:hypothetical protein